MTKYEIMFIVKATLDETALNNITKEVQSLMSGIVFNQTADGIRQLRYNGKTVEMDKDQYKILLSSNRMMISTQVLEGLGIKIVVEYI